MNVRTVLSGFVVLTALVVGGCTSMPSPEGKPMPAMTFKHLHSVSLDVKDRLIEITPTQNVAGFSLNLDDLVKFYLQSKIKPAGEKGGIVALLEESSIARRHESSTNAAIDFFGLGGAEIYDVALRLRLEHRDALGQLIYGTIIHAKRAIKVSEHASIAERETAQYEGVEALFVQLNQHIDKVLIADMKLEK